MILTCKCGKPANGKDLTHYQKLANGSISVYKTKEGRCDDCIREQAKAARERRVREGRERPVLKDNYSNAY